MNLQRFGLIVMALNLVFLPAVRSSAADLLGSSQSITLSSDCGCSMEFDQSSTAPGNKRVPLGPHPQCPTNCTMEVWTWYYCLRESDRIAIFGATTSVDGSVQEHHTTIATAIHGVNAVRTAAS